ncbi:MAG: SpoIIE family protein phosphatase [Cytophagales bacterium]|nr:SpoIIE family protein phosphatase [Cytophagales bacterium]MDW8383463.1 SpoIIE family protein phosphatase [Flammeovirgaceae bacterium]
MKKAQLWVLCAFIIFKKGFTQELGRPFLDNYHPREYLAHSKNYAIVQDRRGVLYIGNTNGILEFDGTTWNMIPVNNNEVTVRSLAIDENDNIFVGAKGEIGYLSPTANGKMKYVSLLDKLPPEEQKFEDVWTTHATPQGVFFLTDNSLFKLHEGKIQIFKPHATNNYFFLSFWINNRLYVHERGQGLMQLNHDVFEPLPGCESLKNERLYVLLPYDDHNLLVGLAGKPLYIYNVFNAKLEPFENDANEFLIEHSIYCGIRLHNGNFAFGTTRGGAIIIDPRGKLVKTITSEDFLQDQNVTYLFEDAQYDIWLALGQGISRAEINSPWQQWDRASGLIGTVYSILRHQDVLYATTSQGLFYLSYNKFFPIADIQGQTWDLLSFKDNNKSSVLLVANQYGLYEVKDGKASLVRSSRAVFKLYHDFFEPDVVYLGTRDGLAKIRRHQSRWEDEGVIKNVLSTVHTIVSEDDGTMWLGNWYEGVARLTRKLDGKKTIYEKQFYDTAAGLPTPNRMQIYLHKGKPIFATKKGIFKFDESQQRFFPDTTFGKIFSDGKHDIFRISYDINGNIWISGFNSMSGTTGILTETPRGYYFYPTPFYRLPSMEIEYIYNEPNGMTWFGGSEGIFRYNGNLRKDYDASFNVLIRQVVLNNDSVIFYGNFYKETKENGVVNRSISLVQTPEMIPQLSYDDNNITFYYTAPYFEGETGTLYSYLIESNQEAGSWSAWTHDIKKEYTNLYEGTYTFKVKARNIYGVESAPTSFQFKILPPWYRTPIAYLGYVLGAFLFIWGIVRLNGLRHERKNRILTTLVAQRTAEVVRQKEEIEMQALQLRKKSEDIEKSINYAKRIQTAMLPNIKEIHEALPESFVWFKPRDVVSGDFYWLAQKNGHTIIAAVDCTGHGVPGAFMSMIGSGILHEIVHQLGILEADKILNNLHLGVRTSLKQDETENRDGMDLALCNIYRNHKGIIVEYAGAKNPLCYVQNGNLVEIKGDKLPIGGIQKEDERIFHKHELIINQTTMFYMFSDGFQDQVGGEKKEKFMSKRFKELLVSIHQLPVEEQEQILESTMRNWMNGYKQVDDMLVIGFRIRPSTT